MSTTRRTDRLDADLAGLEAVWEAGMHRAYDFYLPQAQAPVALAAALVESAAELQCLGVGSPDPPQLLLGDLCLARASRLLAGTRDQRLQVGFARAVERVAAAAAAGLPAEPLRDLLVATIARTR